MGKIKETTWKYLAGFADSDGCLSFVFQKKADGTFTTGLCFTITQAESNDKDFQVMKTLQTETGLGSLWVQEKRRTNWSRIIIWTIRDRHQLESFIPHITKHMCIKARHFQRLLEKRRELSGKNLTQEEVTALKLWSKTSRKDTGPLKEKNYPSAAWIAGYVDGDGCLHFRQKKNSTYVDMHLSINTWCPDMYGINLLHKAYGGKIYKQTNTTNTYYLSFGVTFSSTVKKFLGRIVPYLRIKKHTAEIILAKHQQRLSEKAPTGEATV